jgi:integrase
MKGAKSVQPDLTMREYFEERYMPFAKATKRRPEIDAYNYRLHIDPVFGSVNLRDITLVALDQWVLRQIEQGYKPATVNKHSNIMNRMLNLAATWELIDSNPFKKSLIRHVAIGDQVQRFLDIDEIHHLLSACRASSHPFLYRFVVLLLLTGARKSELRLAKWSWVNSSTRILNVSLSKNGRARRVTLSNDALSWLDELREYATTLGPRASRSDFLFPNPRTGKPYNSFHAAFFAARENAGLPDVRIHDLRHTYASLLINNGASLYEVQKLLGHYHVSMTERYAHLYPDTLHQKAAIAAGSIGLALDSPSDRSPQKPSQSSYLK